MTTDQRRIAYAEALNYTDMDAYVSDVALSSVWGDDLDDGIPADRIDSLRIIWRAIHGELSVKDISAASGMSMRSISSRLHIPARTMDSWGMGERKPPAYTLLMMCEVLGII